MSKWEMVRLGDIGHVLTGSTPKTSDVSNYDVKDIPFYKPGDFNGEGITVLDNAKNYVSNYAKDKIRLLPANSVLVTCIGIIGKVGITKHEATCNQQINAIITDCRKCDERFIAYAILRNHNQLNHIANAPVVPIVNKTQFSNVFIPLPPLSIQQKIADVLDKASALIEKRKVQIEKLDLLIKSQFIEMFGDPATNPRKWTMATIRELVSDVKYGTSKPAEENGKYIYLRMNNITYEGYIDLSDLKYINVDDKDYEKYVVRKGDVLFNRTNSRELVGKTAVFKEDIPMIIAGYIIRIRTNERANPEYISAYLNSQFGKTQLYGMCKAIIGQANINAQELQDIAIMVPPLALQDKFAAFVEKTDEKKLYLVKSLEQYELLYKSLMQKCFRGDLA